MIRPLFTIREAVLPDDRERLLEIIREYLEWLDMDLSHRGIDAEIAAFDSRFTLPSGLFVLAEANGEVVGCVGLLRHDEQCAEVKRLYVRPCFRGHNLGERLVEEIIRKARAIGVPRLMLDAVPQTGFAMTLYERMGFSDCAPFYDGAVPGTRFFEMEIAQENPPPSRGRDRR